jgi:hypothetical protein
MSLKTFHFRIQFIIIKWFERFLYLETGAYPDEFFSIIVDNFKINLLICWIFMFQSHFLRHKPPA